MNESPHPNPLPKGEGTKACPHPNPVPKGEGTKACPHPNPVPKGEGTNACSHPNPFPKGEGTNACSHPNPFPKGDGNFEGRAGEEIVLEAEKFSFSLEGKEILRDVSFSVRRGEYVAIVGPNGAGKTTLLKCFDRLLAGGSGELRIEGRPRNRFRQKELARLVAYVPQADGRTIPFCVEEFLLMCRYPHLSPFSPASEKDRLAVREAMQKTGVVEFSGRQISTLSGGERQKVYIAAALAQGAHIWLLDEPTTFLDYNRQSEIMALTARVNKEFGVSILAVTHDLNRAVLEADRVLALKEGRVVFNGPPAEVMKPDVLKRIYDTSFLLIEHPWKKISMILPTTASGKGND
jgi:iron complex transport system ATP-binding protein